MIFLMYSMYIEIEYVLCCLGLKYFINVNYIQLVDSVVVDFLSSCLINYWERNVEVLSYIYRFV